MVKAVKLLCTLMLGGCIFIIFFPLLAILYALLACFECALRITLAPVVVSLTLVGSMHAYVSIIDFRLVV